MVSTTRMSTTTPSTPNLRTSLPSTRLSPQFRHTSPLLPDLVTCMVFTSPAMSSSTPNFSASTRSMSRMPLERRRTSRFSLSSTVDLDLRRRSTWMPLDMVLLRSTSTPTCNTPTSPVSETTSSTRKIISCSKLVTQMVKINQTKSMRLPTPFFEELEADYNIDTSILEFGSVRVRRPCLPVSLKALRTSTLPASYKIHGSMSRLFLMMS